MEVMAFLIGLTIGVLIAVVLLVAWIDDRRKSNATLKELEAALKAVRTRQAMHQVVGNAQRQADTVSAAFVREMRQRTRSSS